MRKSVITTMLAGATVLALTACTPYDLPSEKPSSPDLPTGVSPHSTSAKPTATATAQSSAGGHNDADVTFAQHLFTQHGYGSQLATLVVPQGAGQSVQDLAKRVLDENLPEQRQLNGWLKSWGTEAPSTGGQTPGAAGAQKLDALKQLHGADFDKQWLSAMIDQHKAELQLANAEQSNGANPDAKALALRLISVNQGEIEEMSQLLNR